MVPVLRFCFRRQDEQLVTGIVQAIDEPAGCPPGMRATPYLHEAFLHPHGHPLIEDETLSLPMLVPKLLLVSRDPAVELENVLESLAPEKRRRLFTANAPVQYISTVLSFKLFQPIHVLRQLAEMFDVANHGVLKFPGVRFKAIPNIEWHGVRTFFQQPFPVGGAQLIVLVRRERAGIQSHDFRANLYDQLWKSPCVPGADFDLDVGEACVCLEEATYRLTPSAEPASVPLIPSEAMRIRPFNPSDEQSSRCSAAKVSGFSTRTYL